MVVVESGASNAAPNGPEAVHHEGVRNVLAGAADGAHIVLVTQIHMTRPDAFPVMRDVIAARARGEAALRASRNPYTIVRPSWLTDDPGGRAALRLEQGDTGEGEVARDDVAEAVVQALANPTEAAGKTFELYGGPGGRRRATGPRCCVPSRRTS